MFRVSRRSGSLHLAASIVLLAASVPAEAQLLRQVTDMKTSDAASPALDDAGTIVYAAACADPFATNSRHAYQIMKWDAVTGSGSQLTSYPEGVSEGQDGATWSGAYSVSISDDGQWVAFVSRANLTGQNHDESPEAFVMLSDGSQILQLSNDSALNAYSVLSLAISGSGNRVAFVANTNPLGTNNDHLQQLFSINRDGTNLKQVTNITFGMSLATPGFFDISISDDGNKIAFTNQMNLTGGNLDSTWEVFGVNSDGTNLHQITGSAFHATHPSVSGDGTKVAYETQGNITVANWDGTGKLTLTAGNHPSMTDDGQFVVFASTQIDGSTNADGNSEIWKIKTDATTKTLLTNTTAPTQNHNPVVSGAGGRVAFSSRTTAPGAGTVSYRKANALKVMSGTGSGLLTLTTAAGGDQYWPTITPDGTRIVFASYSNLLGTDPDRGGDLYRIEADGTSLTQVTSLTDGAAQRPSIASDRDTIVFFSTANPLGTNPSNFQQIFKVRADGTSLVQLTSADGCGVATNPSISANGAYVVFESCANLTGGNADGSNEVFRVAPNGSGLLQITNDPGTHARRPRTDDNATVVVFESSSDLDGGNDDGTTEIWRMTTGGTGLFRVTTDTDFDSTEPDISGSGTRIAYSSQGNPTGNNADHNFEIFTYDTTTQVRRQLTNTSGGDNKSPRISRDGLWVYFKSSAPIYELAPGSPWQPYVVEVLTAAVDRVGGLRHGSGADLQDSFIPGSGYVATTTDGKKAVFAGAGDWIDRNGDFNYEVYLSELTGQQQKVTVSKATPTLFTYEADPLGLRYDVIRGDRANIFPSGPGLIGLGPVVCLEEDSPDLDNAGAEDVASPPAGKTWFYLSRPTQGGTKVEDYGRATSGAFRVATSGDCIP
jgi:Tol biopolymer transport system component